MPNRPPGLALRTRRVFKNQLFPFKSSRQKTDEENIKLRGAACGARPPAFFKNPGGKMHTAFKELLEQTILYLPRLTSGLIIFFCFWLAAHFAHKIILRFSNHSRVNPVIIELATTTLKVTFLAFGAVTALGTLGINVSALVASLGLTGFALGFALRDALSNLLAGVLILIYCTYKINDKIAVSGFEGTVTKINLRYTLLQSEEVAILIPNATMFSNPIKILSAAELCSENQKLAAGSC
jgi:small conductance mechanosensitive channel